MINHTMKKNYLLFLFVSGFMMSGQTPRLCLYELFTGETCQPTASSNPFVNALLAQPANVAKMVAINWEVPIPSAPTATWSLYQTNKSEIDWRYKSTGAGGYGYSIIQSPMGLIDGQSQGTFGAGGIHTLNMNSTVIATAQSYTSAFSVTMQRAWNPTFTGITLTVNILATANFTATGALVFRTVMTERNVDFSVAPGTTGEKHFEHVVIKSFPSIQSGVSMAGTWSLSQSQTFTLYCALPSYVRDKSEIEFVGFIQDNGNRKVAQAVRSGPDPLPDDIKAISIFHPTLNCSSSVYSPTLLVKNSGANSITSFTVNPLINGISVSPVLWTGLLNPGDSAWVALNSYTGSPMITGNNTITCNIVLTGDNNLVNNNRSLGFYVPFPIMVVTANALVYCVGDPVTLTGTGAHQYVWNNIPTTSNFISFTAAQSGTFIIAGTNTITNCTTQLVYNLIVNICVGFEDLSKNEFLVFPNPFLNSLSIKTDYSGAEKQFKIKDQLGREVLTGKLEGEITVIDVSAFSAGHYILEVGDRRVKIIK